MRCWRQTGGLAEGSKALLITRIRYVRVVICIVQPLTYTPGDMRLQLRGDKYLEVRPYVWVLTALSGRRSVALDCIPAYLTTM